MQMQAGANPHPHPHPHPHPNPISPRYLRDISQAEALGMPAKLPRGAALASCLRSALTLPIPDHIRSNPIPNPMPLALTLTVTIPNPNPMPHPEPSP